MMRRCLALALALVPAPALAQGAAPSAEQASAPASDRLVLARGVVDQIMPPDRREDMIEAMVRPTLANMRQALMAQPQLARLVSGEPRMAALLNRYLDEETDHSLAVLRQSLPELVEAMAGAYARQFSREELEAMRLFFDSPAGRAYVDKSAALMTDSAVLAVERTMMVRSMDGLQERAAAFAASMAAKAAEEDAK